MEFYQSARVRVDGLRADIKRYSQVLDSLPEGSLHIVNNGRYVKFYNYHGVADNGREIVTYISKKKCLSDAVRLWERKYLGFMIREKQTEINDIMAFLDVRKRHEISIEEKCFSGCGNEMLSMMGIAHISAILGRDFSDSEYIGREWQNDTYEKSYRNPEHLKFEGPRGIMMRSKAETIIAAELEKAGVPYRYECIHRMDGYRIAPDFTIRRPADGKIIIWEHFGLWSRPDYRQAMYKKLETYARHGYCPGNNLMFSFETPECPFVPGIAEKMIQQHLI